MRHCRPKTAKKESSKFEYDRLGIDPIEDGRSSHATAVGCTGLQWGCFSSHSESDIAPTTDVGEIAYADNLQHLFTYTRMMLFFFRRKWCVFFFAIFLENGLPPIRCSIYLLSHNGWIANASRAWSEMIFDLESIIYDSSWIPSSFWETLSFSRRKKISHAPNGLHGRKPCP